MRPVSLGDMAQITGRLSWLKAKGGYLPDHADVETAVAGIVEYNRRNCAVIHEGFLILFDVGKEWFSDHIYLFEKFVLKLEPTAQAVMVPAILESMAIHFGCDAVIAGDSLAGKMTPFYERAGWSHLGTTLTKEITHVRRQDG